ncbi:uncharacterized protein N7525_009811 [Penicillium rubens]|uniref:uncharacterized protein n=1 Tax=Penicillium rubens TaxID=1108849 RepID=UPI002A59AFD5|nr:uncharacterized protein N7525_009811 [Penicillium rubens]KAJ5831558.1 hypothetical protein N7525_009811 [Penicillium rubens]KAJ5855104.1 hypothetical protein N7534_007647 [Penicillium rubens]
MSVMTKFVSFVSLNHPGVVHEFHGPIPIATCQSKALGLYFHEYWYQVALKVRNIQPWRSMTWPWAKPPSSLRTRRLRVASFAMNFQKEISGKSEGKKDAEKRDDQCRMHKIHTILI